MTLRCVLFGCKIRSINLVISGEVVRWIDCERKGCRYHKVDGVEHA